MTKHAVRYGGEYSCVTDEKTGVVAMDIVMIGIGVVFFALTLAYVKACDSV